MLPPAITLPREEPTRRARALRVAQTAMSVVGVGAAAVMLFYTDFGAVRAFGRWAVVVVALEGVRVGSEAVATRCLHGDAVRVPFWPLVRAHMVGYAVAMSVPAGRAVAEGAKSYMLAPWTRGPRAAATGVANQSLVLASTGTLALVSAGPSFALGLRALAVTSLGQGAVLVAMGLGLVAIARSERLRGWVARRHPRLAARVEGAHDLVSPRRYAAAWACFLVHRGVQTIQLLVLLGALGQWDLLRASALAGAVIVGVSAGVAVPGQLGAVGAALALVAPPLGLTAAQALAMALVIHAGQFAWIAAGFAVSALTRSSRPTA